PLVWYEHLYRRSQRGVEVVLLGVVDRLTRLDSALKEVSPKADVQRCVVHKVRNTKAAVRVKDEPQLLEDLKKVYHAVDRSEALQNFKDFKKTWQTIYPKVIKSWAGDLNDLLRFYDYPRVI